MINSIGAFFFLLGLFIGYKWRPLRLVDTIIKINFLQSIAVDDDRVKKIIKLSNVIFIIGIIGIIVSFMLMGFMPMFASDPFLAKFFKGQYQAPYQRVAFLYRTSRQMVELFIPLMVLEIFLKPKFKNIALVLIAIILIAVSLNRGAIAGGALVAIAIAVGLKKKNMPFWTFLILVFITYGAGSAIYYIVLQFSGDSEIGKLGTGDNIFEAIAYGAPDILDQLGFLSAYIKSGSHLTYGLTFVGGLIPFNFPWNPAIYTLTILNDINDVSEIASGGLRLPVSIWGYVSFGWLGVAVVPFISAFFTGYITKKVKTVLQNISADKNGYVTFFMAYFMYSNIAMIFTNFLYLSIYMLPAFIIYYLLIKYSNNTIKLN
ncbi:hypothetical protein KXQ82_09155 [Mucilaginibacter sp. HMF5004]|uniref:hypothetical protein n=1 Tax=Mucilaginibacter rivuli TaxID=2857527 RepID=UPI001C5E7930|nr:hypothetical protein [Mucilaginibacter rivuli]MBW4889883.1 hypothetical protein [Mucilaginibacter rivuli]